MAATVDPGYAGWLKSPARLTASTVADAAAKWPDLTVDSTVISPLADQAAAQAEAASQAAFMTGPLARDRIVVAGQQSALVGFVVNITGDRLGYELGADVMVIGAQEAERGGTTTLTVLKRL